MPLLHTLQCLMIWICTNTVSIMRWNFKLLKHCKATSHMQVLFPKYLAQCQIVSLLNRFSFITFVIKRVTSWWSEHFPALLALCTMKEVKIFLCLYVISYLSNLVIVISYSGTKQCFLYFHLLLSNTTVALCHPSSVKLRFNHHTEGIFSGSLGKHLGVGTHNYELFFLSTLSF